MSIKYLSRFTQNKYIILKNLSKQDAADWIAWLTHKHIKYIIL